jgi:hypothetical protein
MTAAQSLRATRRCPRMYRWFAPVRSLSRHDFGEGGSFLSVIAGQKDQLAAMHRDPCGNFSNVWWPRERPAYKVGRELFLMPPLVIAAHIPFERSSH